MQQLPVEGLCEVPPGGSCINLVIRIREQPMKAVHVHYEPGEDMDRSEVVPMLMRLLS